MARPYSEDPSMPKKAYSQLQDCLDNARSAGETDVLLMAVATCGANAKPSVRHMLAADINEYGILFFTNKESGKGQQLSENPHVSLCFYWQSLRQQLVIEGIAGRASNNEAESVWRKRDRDKQIAAWASTQSDASRGKKSHQQRLTKTRQTFGFEHVPLPDNWAAYRVAPTRMEFWKADWRSAQARVAYELKDGQWSTIAYDP